MTYENYLRNRENRLRNSNQGKCGCGSPQLPFCSCSSSSIRLIYRTEDRNVFGADIFLDCSGVCSGHDEDIVVTWTLNRISGDVRIVGPNNQGFVRVEGTGMFTLTLNVLFRCRYLNIPGPFIPTEDCPRTLTSQRYTL